MMQASGSEEGPHVSGALDFAIFGQGAGRFREDDASQQDDDARTSCSNAVVVKAPGLESFAKTRPKAEMHARRA